MSDDEFELQLQQEAEERERNEKLKAGKVKVDPDGTVYEWDEEKKAWFPRVSSVLYCIPPMVVHQTMLLYATAMCVEICS